MWAPSAPVWNQSFPSPRQIANQGYELCLPGSSGYSTRGPLSPLQWLAWPMERHEEAHCWTLEQSLHRRKALLSVCRSLFDQERPHWDLCSTCCTHTHTHTHTHLFNGHLSRTTQVSRYQKGKTSLDFTGHALRAAWPTVSKHWRSTLSFYVTNNLICFLYKFDVYEVTYTVAGNL